MADTKGRIMACAEQLFYQKGYDATGVQEIAELAGITKPTLYYYFGSKRGLLETLLQTKFEKLAQETGKEAGRREEIREKLHHLAQGYFRFFSKEHDFYMLLMALCYSARENEAYQAVRPYLEGLYQMVVEVFLQAAPELGNMNGRQEQFAMSFIGVVNQFLLQCSDSTRAGRRSQAEQLRSLVDQYMYGIFT